MGDADALSNASGMSLESKRRLLRSLPSIDELLRLPEVVEAAKGAPRSLVVNAARRTVDERRNAMLAEGAAAPDAWGPIVADAIQRARRHGLRRVINATGVLLHTNLGRAPLSERALDAVRQASRGYSNLEFDLESGARGSRHGHVEELLKTLTGAEAALAVNNNAAAVLLLLSATAAGGEVVISRGELVEIGGSFRIPDVLRLSGCALVEVGATNRTHLHDYESAITPETQALLKVHTSNFRVVGFTRAVAAKELADFAHERGLYMFHDLGSGTLLSTDAYGLGHEPAVAESIEAGADAVTFSGDKLLGGPQAGIIAGRRDVIDRCRLHPLARAVRIDKMSLAALEATLRSYVEGSVREIPLWRMLAASQGELKARAEGLAAKLRQAVPTTWAKVDVVQSETTVGGGSLPGETLPTWVARVSVERPDQLAQTLRGGDPPVVARIEAEALLLDPRTILPDEDDETAAAVAFAVARQREQSTQE